MILDAPPLVSVQDCRVIARWVDGLIVVVSAHRTPKRLVEEALNVVDPSKGLGFVFNNDDRGVARLYGGPRGADATGRLATARGWGRTLKRIGTRFIPRNQSPEGEDE